jgi:hypothetical protein
MKSITRLPFIFLVLASLLFMAGCATIPSFDDGLVIGNNYRLASGQTLNHDLTVIGGNATLEQDSTVNGDVAVMGGTLRIDGRVNGDVSVMGGSVRLDDNAVVRGSLNQLGGSIDQSQSARVEGQNDFNNRPFGSTTMRTPPVNVNFDPITGPMLAFFRALALAALAVLLQLFAPIPMQRVGQTAQNVPLISGGVGLLTVLVGPALLVIVAITIILLPVSLLGLLLLGVAVVFGWLALGLITGQHLARLFKQTWSDPINAGVGTLALSLVASMANLIWCVGWLATLLISAIGLGAVILTRFGTRSYTLAPAPQPYASTPAVYTGPVGTVGYPPVDNGARVYDTPASDAPNLYDDLGTADDRSPEDPNRPLA